ncbi:MAG TPA: DUF3810 family protein [Vicinamibacterales bacterium]|nr:DUF3810 family protein [Vicinamibacterales bacterium]
MPFLRTAIILVAIAAAMMPFPAAWIERVYSRVLYPSWQPYVTFVSNLSPIALLDVGIALLLVRSGVALRRDWRVRGSRRAFVAAAGRLTTTAAVIYLLFLSTWGLNYRRVPLEARLEFDRARIGQAAATQLATLAIERVNAGYVRAHSQAFRPDALERALAETQLLLGSTHQALVGRPKLSVAGFYFRYAAVDGMTVPVFLEIILNPDILPIEMPSVLAHEWAHLAGYADESEASFVSWIAGVRSDDPVAQYSAWLDAYALAVNALPRSARASLPALAPGPLQDLRDIAARYARSSPRVRAAARGVYDSYLKANRIEEGIANYGVALQLILGTGFDEDWKPRLR